jgi:hypothetical protein
MLKVYRDKLVGPAPGFPVEMEENIDAYLKGELPPKDAIGFANPPDNLPYSIYPSKNESGRLIFTNE